MTQIQMGRYDALLRRVADLKGPGSKVNDVLEELFPTFDVENLPPELYILAQTDLCWGGGFVAGTSSQAGRGQIFNPAGSGKVITVTTAACSIQNVGIVRWGRRDVLLTNHLQTQLFRDVRHPFGNLPTGQIRAQTSVALANATGQTRTLPDVNVILQDPNGLMVLTEGTGFEIGGNINFSAISFYFYWRERVAEPSEINF